MISKFSSSLHPYLLPKLHHRVSGKRALEQHISQKELYIDGVRLCNLIRTSTSVQSLMSTFLLRLSPYILYL